MLKLFSGLVSIFNTILKWIEREKLIQTGEQLQKGKQDEKTLDAIQKAHDAVANPDRKQLDDELCVDK